MYYASNEVKVLLTRASVAHLSERRLSPLLTWVQFPLGTTYDSYMKRVSQRSLPKVVGFLRVLRFPPTGNVDRVGWVNPNWPFHRSCAP